MNYDESVSKVIAALARTHAGRLKIDPSLNTPELIRERLAEAAVPATRTRYTFAPPPPAPRTKRLPARQIENATDSVISDPRYHNISRHSKKL